MKRTDLVNYLDDYLQINAIKDYGPQGLQIEGCTEVNRIIGLVDAHQPCVDAAIAQNADLMLVHHGIFWGAAKPIRGSYGALIRTFMQAELNLYAAHLALDAHHEIGNNAELARRLGLTVIEWWGNAKGVQLAAVAVSGHGGTHGVKLDDLVIRFEQNVGPIKLVQAHGPALIHKVGILSGSGAGEIEEAAALGCDLYITGETSHAQYYDAQNAGLNLIYGGHYTTETVGVQALGNHLQEQFDIEFAFIDLPTGL